MLLGLPTTPAPGQPPSLPHQQYCNRQRDFVLTTVTVHSRIHQPQPSYRQPMTKTLPLNVLLPFALTISFHSPTQKDAGVFNRWCLVKPNNVFLFLPVVGEVVRVTRGRNIAFSRNVGSKRLELSIQQVLQVIISSRDKSPGCLSLASVNLFKLTQLISL